MKICHDVYLGFCHISKSNMKTVMIWLAAVTGISTYEWREKICSQVENPKTFSTSYFLYTHRKLHDQCESWGNWLSPERSRAQDIHPNPGYIHMKPDVMLKRGLHGICWSSVDTYLSQLPGLNVFFTWDNSLSWKISSNLDRLVEGSWKRFLIKTCVDWWRLVNLL